MVSRKDKRFFKYWEEQRVGGRWSYIISYTLVGTFIFTLIISVFLLLFLQTVFGSPLFWIVLSSGFILNIFITVISWTKNEKRFAILNEEVLKELEKENGQKDLPPQ